LASLVGTLPARNVPDFLLDLLVKFASSPQFPDFTVFASEEAEAIAGLVSPHQHVPSFTEDRNYYYDWGAEELFSLAGRGPGECGAGVFELIEVDLASAHTAWEQARYFAATALAARALLVTRGEQADSDKAALELFQKHFASQNLVLPEHARLVQEALMAASTPDPERAFAGKADDTGAFVAAVRKLYDSMDASLRPSACSVGAPPTQTALLKAAPASAISADLTKDFRGTACPMNYVKTKLELEQMEPGQVLAVLLNEQGAQNVPASVAGDGHEVLETTREGDHWRVSIRRAKE
jgi:sulfite reductase (ferredoxin)